MLLNKLLKAIQPVQVTGESDIEITGINIDSRLVEAGQLFMAMRGTQADGHAYIPTAIEKGVFCMSKAVIFFAPGLEECEGLLCVDLLRWF